ncbi:MAG: Gfo/Idh/MocA family oxidoreductase [Candidatus Omnitrophota bacterium]
MKKVKIAVIGCGRLGAFHARIYRELSGSRLTATCDIDRQRAEDTAGKFSVKAVYDYRKLIGKIDAVSICAPTRKHYEIARFFLREKVHVLIEKPITDNIAEAKRLVTIAAKNKSIIQVGHIERFNCAFTTIKPIIKNPRFIECHRLSLFPRRSLDVGVVLDVMIHDIDIILGLMTSPIEQISAVGVNVLTDKEDIANARIRFRNGCIANLTASRVSDETMRKIRIFLNNTYISLDYGKQEAFIYNKEGDKIGKRPIPIEKEEPLKKELSSFLACVSGNKKPLVSGKEGLKALELALAIQNDIRKTKLCPRE